MVAIIFPSAIIFADDNPLGGFAALVMQASLIGWIPAVIWAWKIIHRTPEAQATKDAEKELKSKKPPQK